MSNKALTGKNGVVPNGVGKLDPLNHHPAIQPKAFLSSTSRAPAADPAANATDASSRTHSSVLNNNVIASSTCTTSTDEGGQSNANSQPHLLTKTNCAPAIRATLSSAADNRNNNVRCVCVNPALSPDFGEPMQILVRFLLQ